MFVEAAISCDSTNMHAPSLYDQEDEEWLQNVPLLWLDKYPS
jgi:hypothetical protein